jgi:hypothetical protein
MKKVVGFFAVFLCGVALAGNMAYRVEDDAVHLDLGNGTELEFSLHDGWILGLRSARAQGIQLSAEDTVQRPVIAQDFGDEQRIAQVFRFGGIEVDGDRAVLTLEAVATKNPDHLSSVFVMRGSRDLLEEKGMTPELAALRDAADAARTALNALADANTNDRLSRAMRELKEAEEQMAAVSENEIDTHVEILAVQNLERRQRNVRNLRNRILRDIESDHPEVETHRETIRTWEAARDEAAGSFQVIHRDFYKFPIWRQPNEVNTLEALKERIGEAVDAGEPAGTIRWVIEPRTEVVGGWPWKGWTQFFELELADEMRNNHFAVLGTWEIGGDVLENTLFALRYRGLGGLVQSFSADEDGGAAEAFTTTEIIPGAAGGAPLVSPVVAGEGITGGRTEALQHRVGAWIAQPGRGAGAPFFDFHVGAEALFAAVPARQGNLRAVTEVMPGDRHISQTDLEYFALGTRHTTIPFHYLVLAPGDGEPFTLHENRTRYQEMDQHVRRVVSEELGMVQFDVLPGIHYMFDHNFGGSMRSVANQMDELAELGVRRIETHHHGWQNGRIRQPGQDHIGGGVCDIYDYWPLREVEEPWRDATKAAARHGIPHYVWLTGMNRIGGPLFEHIGPEIERWAFPEPNPTSIFRDSTGYAGNVNFNMHNEVTRERLLTRLQDAREQFGYQGFWADSFQNLFMSQLDWAQGTGDSLQRKWWEIIAKWSREGVSFTSESHAFPGQSCSIEVQQGWSDETFFLVNQVNRAFRANTFPNAGEPEADVLAFSFMANRGWAAPDMRAGQVPTRIVPSFQRLSNEYMTALPLMRRSVQLPDDQGVLWLGYAGDEEGVWFSKTPASVPAGVTATPILGGDAVAETEAIHTYSVRADNLLEAFGIRRAPREDERIGTEWEPPSYFWPEWVGE